MNKCNLHTQKDAKRVCIKCGKTFCDECAKQTDYTGYCTGCEASRQQVINKYSRKKVLLYVSDAIACFVGAMVCLVLHFVFDDFKKAGIIGVCVLGTFCVAFCVLLLDNALKAKRSKKISDNLQNFAQNQKEK